MARRQEWREAHEVPAELVQTWLDREWFESLRKEGMSAKKRGRLLESSATGSSTAPEAGAATAADTNPNATTGRAPRTRGRPRQSVAQSPAAEPAPSKQKAAPTPAASGPDKEEATGQATTTSTRRRSSRR